LRIISGKSEIIFERIKLSRDSVLIYANYVDIVVQVANVPESLPCPTAMEGIGP
jgi:hypothetical protein